MLPRIVNKHDTKNSQLSSQTQKRRHGWQCRDGICSWWRLADQRC